MKKILAILLFLSMIFAMTACGGDKENENDTANGAAVTLDEKAENNLENAQEKPLDDDNGEYLEDEYYEDEEYIDYSELESDPVPEGLTGAWNGTLDFIKIMSTMLGDMEGDENAIAADMISSYNIDPLNMSIEFADDYSCSMGYEEGALEDFAANLVDMLVDIATNVEFIAATQGCTVEEAQEMLDEAGMTAEDYRSMYDMFLSPESLQETIGSMNTSYTYFVDGSDIIVIDEVNETEIYFSFEEGILTMSDLGIVFEK